MIVEQNQLSSLIIAWGLKIKKHDFSVNNRICHFYLLTLGARIALFLKEPFRWTNKYPLAE